MRGIVPVTIVVMLLNYCSASSTMLHRTPLTVDLEMQLQLFLGSSKYIPNDGFNLGPTVTLNGPGIYTFRH
jgi:hypothetical protein